MLVISRHQLPEFFSWVTHNKTDTKIVVQFHKRASASGGLRPTPPTGALPLEPTGGLPSPDTLLCRPNSRLLSPALSIVTGDNGDEKDIKVAAVHTAKGCSRMTSFWLTLDIPCTSQ